MKKLLCTYVAAFIVFVACSQSVGVGTAVPHSSARLDVQSTDKGMLVPRIALTAANVAAPVTSPADALLLYNTATSGTGENAVSPGFYYWSAAQSKWISLRTSDVNSSSPGFGNWGDCSVKNVSGYDPVVADDGVNGDLFGRSVAISGNWAIVGASNDDIGANADQGSAYLFFFNGVSWVQRQKIVAGDGQPGDRFGAAVSISGNYAVVGAPNDDTGALNDSGCAYVFFYNGTSWVQVVQPFLPIPASGDMFGFSVCMKDSRMIIGAYADDIGANAAQGSAHVYFFNGSNWLYQAQLTAPDGAASDNFGASVGIDNVRVIVGAPNDDIAGISNQGSAHVYFYNGTVWAQQQKFINNTFAAIDDNYGQSVAISGNTVVIGCPGHSSDRGIVDVWTLNVIVWTNTQTIVPPVTGAQQYVGRSMTIDGDYFITGASGVDVNNVDGAGKVFIYKNYSGLWRLYEDFSDPAAGPVDALGAEVAMHSNRFVCGLSLPPDQLQRGVAIFGKIE
jgi:hypothetical protein